MLLLQPRGLKECDGLSNHVARSIPTWGASRSYVRESATHRIYELPEHRLSISLNLPIKGVSS